MCKGVLPKESAASKSIAEQWVSSSERAEVEPTLRLVLHSC